MGVRIFRRLCRDLHVLLNADSELDLDLIVMVDLDSLHQPGNNHVLGLRVGLVEGVRPGKQIGHFLGGSLRCVLFLFHLGFGLFHPALGGFQLFLVLRHHGVHDADVHGVLPREELHGLILQGVHLIVGFEEILLSLLVGHLVHIAVVFFRLFQQGCFRLLLDDGKYPAYF